MDTYSPQFAAIWAKPPTPAKTLVKPKPVVAPPTSQDVAMEALVDRINAARSVV